MTGRVWAIANVGVADAAALAHVAQTSFQHTFAHMPYAASDLRAFLDTAMGEARFAAQLADPDYAMVGTLDAAGTLCGYIKLGPNELPMPAGEPDPSTTRELHQLYLLPQAHGSGMADALMAWGIDEARGRGASHLYLSVYVGNDRAKRFYARHGFVEIGKNAFRVGATVDDDRVWRLRL